MLTELFTLNGEGDGDKIRRAAACIREGGLVVFPTETVYGLGGDATDPRAAEKIYAAKGRPSDNPLIIHIASPADAEPYAVLCPLYERLAAAFMPGPLTVILPVRPSIPRSVTAGLDTVAVRCPRHPVARALIAEAGVPIAAPSANLSGSPSPTCASHVAEDMNGRVDIILDGGDCEIGLESTIVKLEPDGGLTLLRPGAITPEQLAPFTENFRIADAVLGRLKAGERVLSPGMKYKHYAPKLPLFLLDGPLAARLSYLEQQEGKCAVLCYEEELAAFSRLPSCVPISVGKQSDPSALAHRLFYLLREADKGSYTRLYAPLPRPDGLGLALYNRMIRAAADHIIRV